MCIICLKWSMCQNFNSSPWQFSYTGSFIMWSHAALCDRRPSSCQRWPFSRRSWATCRLSWATRSRATCSLSTESQLLVTAGPAFTQLWNDQKAEEENCLGHMAQSQILFVELGASSPDTELGSVCVCYSRPNSDTWAMGHFKGYEYSFGWEMLS